MNSQVFTDYSPVVPPKVQLGTRIPKVEMGTWNSVKREYATLTNRDHSKGHKLNSVSQTELVFIIYFFFLHLS